MLRHLLSKSAGTLSDETEKHKTMAQTPRLKTMQVWLCDVCRKRFREYDAACRHEEQCKLDAQKSSTSDPPKPVHPFFAQDKISMVEEKSCHPPVAKKEQKEKVRISRSAVVSVDSSQEHIPSLVGGKRTRATVVNTSTLPAPPIQKKRRAVKTRESTNDARPKLEIINVDRPPKARKIPVASIFAQPGMEKVLAEHRAAEFVSKRRADAERSKMDIHVDRPSKSQKGPVASIFSQPGMEKVLAEHRAAEFVSKRRADAERDRERQRRRINSKQQEPTAAEVTVPMEVEPGPKSMYVPAVQFPSYSHVIGDIEGVTVSNSNSVQWVNEGTISKAHACLVQSARHPGSVQPGEEVDCCSLLRSEAGYETSEADTLHEAMLDFLIPPKQSSEPCGMLWSDKYAIKDIPNDLCGEQNRDTAERLIRFVDDWKVERRKAHDRRAEKQRKLLRLKKGKRKIQYKDDDDLWDDSDDEELELRCVCLITGPSGSGKTSLVHAVARRSDCAVLEINTSERRGGQALKHAIEEATQSDSTLDMLKNKNAADGNPFEDSENAKGSSVIVILIDEVDNLYEEDGDSGFWTALHSLTKKAKCPIFLTANTIPESIVSSSIRYRHFETTLPRPEECMSKMWQVVQQEGFSLRHDAVSIENTTKEHLASIAQLCRCDLRRIINEFQLFASAKGSQPRCMENHVTQVVDKVVLPSFASSGYKSPVILGISPKVVHPNDFSLLTIKGKNFMSLAFAQKSVQGPEYLKGRECEVIIGDQPCTTSCVMDDFTILAVCPPCPTYHEDTDVFDGTFGASISSKFARVSARSVSRVGLISTTDCTLQREVLVDGASFASSSIWNIEYGSPTIICGRSREDQNHTNEEEEIELSGDGHLVQRKHHSDTDHSGSILPETATGSLVHLSHSIRENAANLLQNGVTKWRSVHSDYPSQNQEYDACHHFRRGENESLTDLERLAYHALLESDAALFEDAFRSSTPYLAGASRGFGTDLIYDYCSGQGAPGGVETDKIKLHRSANGKPPSFERLRQLGWNEGGCYFGDSDAYVTHPTSSLERRLLARSEALSRGTSLPSSSVSTSLGMSDIDEFDNAEVTHSVSSALDITDLPECALEDMFLQAAVPTAVLSLPSYLRSHSGGSTGLKFYELDLMDHKMRSTHASKASMLSMLLGEDANARLGGATDVLLSTKDSMDLRLLLDYYPILCNMAIHERAAEHAFQLVLQGDPEAAAALNRTRPKTRRTGQTTRSSYFTKRGSNYDDTPEKEIVVKLASAILHF